MRNLFALYSVLSIGGGQDQDMFGVPSEFIKDYVASVGVTNILFVLPDNSTSK